MRNPGRVFAIAALLGLLVLGALALRLFLDVNAYKPRLEAAASHALGMEVRVGGGLGVSFFPGLRVTLEDVRLRNRGMEVAAAKRVGLGIDVLPLLRNQVRIGKIALEHASITLVRDREGRFNFEKAEAAEGTLPALELAQASLSDGTLRYLDQGSGAGFEASHCRLEVSRLRLAERARPGGLKDLSLAAELACGALRSRRYAASDLKISLAGKHGVFDLDPVTLNVFDGQGAGRIHADFTGAAPVYQVRYALTRFHVEAFLEALSPQRVATGAMDASVDLSMRGKTVRELRQTAQGKLSLRGKQLTLHGRDLDRDFARFESSQNFNLVDVGAYFFTGPFGLAVTKGYDFARIFHGSGGRSEIRTLVSDWQVGRGMAQARDVAMATRENRVALQGTLDLANARFNDVTLALIDAKGCAKVRQRLRGTFQKPAIEQPDTLKSLSGPVLTLLTQVKALFPGSGCEVFYAGSVAPPK